jgi:hypothetical protein
MSIGFDSSDAYIARTTSVPGYAAFTVAGWCYFNSLPAAVTNSVFCLSQGGTTEIARLLWRGDLSAFRFGHANAATSYSSNPTAGQWAYFYLRSNATDLQSGWKLIADSDFSGKQWSQASITTATASVLRVGSNVFNTTSGSFDLFRLSVWDEFVSDANLLLAAATDLGYITNLNTHLPLTNGIASPYADTSGNARDWTANGTIGQNQSDPFGAATGIPKSTKFLMTGIG